MQRRFLLVLPALLALSISPAMADEGWVTIFDGKTFDGWKINENPESWSIKDGALVAKGDRSHLFYVGDEKPFVNFEFLCEVKTTPGSNGGIYFHTRFQESGWPRYGYEAQVNVTHKDPKKTGSLYGVVNVSNPPCKDNEYWIQHVIVKGKDITIKINGETVVQYKEPEDKKAFSPQFERRLGKGTFALQAHDPNSVVHFRKIHVRRLP